MNRIPRKKKKKYKKLWTERFGYEVEIVKNSIDKPLQFEPWGCLTRPKYPQPLKDIVR